jgi:hypothetical protein
LFGLGVPATNHEHEHRRYAGFQKAKKETLGVETLPIVASGRAHQTYAPNANDGGSNAFDSVLQ